MADWQQSYPRLTAALAPKFRNLPSSQIETIMRHTLGEGVDLEDLEGWDIGKVDWGGVAQGALGGAASGAALGPWGALAGGLAGAGLAAYGSGQGSPAAPSSPAP